MMKQLLLLSVGVQLLSAVVLAELRADGGYAGTTPRKCIPFRYKKKEGENDFEWFPEPGGADDLFEGCVSIDEYPPFQDNDVQTPVDQNTEQTKWCVFDYKGDDANTDNAKNYNPEQETDDRNKAWGYCLDTNSGGETTPEPTASEATPEPTASEATPEPTASEATPEPTASEATPEPTTEPPVVSPGEDQADGGYAGAEPRKCVPFRYKKKKGQNDFDWFPSEPGKDELFQGCVSIDEYIPFGLPPFESDDVQDPTKPETNQSMWCVFDDAAENYNPEQSVETRRKSWGYCLSSSNVVEPTSEPTASEATPEPTASEATPEPTASEATPEPTASETTPEPTTPTTTSPTISPTTPNTPNPTTSPFEAQGSGPGNPNDENEVNVAAIVVPIVLVVLIAIAAVWFVIDRRKKQQLQEEALPVTKSDQSGGPQEGPMKRFSKAASSSFSNLKGSFTKASAEPLQEPATSVAASAEPVTVTTTAPVDTTTATTATTNDATTAATTTTAAAAAATTTTAAASASAATPNAATTNDATTAAATASTTTTNDNTTAATTATDATNSTSPTNNLTSS